MDRTPQIIHSFRTKPNVSGQRLLGNENPVLFQGRHRAQIVSSTHREHIAVPGAAVTLRTSLSHSLIALIESTASVGRIPNTSSSVQSSSMASCPATVQKYRRAERPFDVQRIPDIDPPVSLVNIPLKDSQSVQEPAYNLPGRTQTSQPELPGCQKCGPCGLVQPTLRSGPVGPIQIKSGTTPKQSTKIISSDSPHKVLRTENPCLMQSSNSLVNVNSTQAHCSDDVQSPFKTTGSYPVQTSYVSSPLRTHKCNGGSGERSTKFVHPELNSDKNQRGWVEGPLCGTKKTDMDGPSSPVRDKTLEQSPSPLHVGQETEGDLELVIPLDEVDDGDEDRKKRRRKILGKRKRENKPEEDAAPVTCDQEQDLDQTLEDGAKLHNLSVANVRNILHEVITNEHVVAMMKAAITETEGLTLFEPKMTRSKLKEVVEKGVVIPAWNLSPIKKANKQQAPQFVDIPLEEEDSSDEEYRPDDEEEDETAEESLLESDVESTGSSPRGHKRLRTYGLSVPVEKGARSSQKQVSAAAPRHISAESVPMGPPPPPPRVKVIQDSMFMEKLHAVDEELDNNPVCMDSLQALDDSLIAFRTRSKRPLKDVPIGQLEAELQAPDITPDMYDHNTADDEDWKMWLCGLMQDDVGNEDEADDDDDPEYNILEDWDEPDTEDLRNDRAVRITKKEVNELMEELFETFQDEIGPSQLEDDCPDDEGSNPDPPISFNTPQTIRFDVSLANLLTEQHRTVKAQLEFLRMRKSMMQTEGEKSPELDPPKIPKSQVPPKLPPVMCLDTVQKGRLQQQIQQHVQLLTQLHLLTFRDPRLSTEASIAQMYLVELSSFAESSVLSHRPFNPDFQSVFQACNLRDALQLIPLVHSQVPEDMEAPKPERKKVKFLSLPKHIAWIMATNSLFMYPELLPLSAMKARDPRDRVFFTKTEDNLLALGLKHFEGSEFPKQFISKYLLTTKTPRQLTMRIKNLTMRKAPDNIIKFYKEHKTLPAMNRCCDDVLPHYAKPPVEREKHKLPFWIKSSLSSIKIEMEKLEKGTKLRDSTYPFLLPPGVTLSLKPLSRRFLGKVWRQRRTSTLKPLLIQPNPSTNSVPKPQIKPAPQALSFKILGQVPPLIQPKVPVHGAINIPMGHKTFEVPVTSCMQSNQVANSSATATVTQIPLVQTKVLIPTSATRRTQKTPICGVPKKTMSKMPGIQIAPCIQSPPVLFAVPHIPVKLVGLGSPCGVFQPVSLGNGVSVATILLNPTNMPLSQTLFPPPFNQTVASVPSDALEKSSTQTMETDVHRGVNKVDDEWDSVYITIKVLEEEDPLSGIGGMKEEAEDAKEDVKSDSRNSTQVLGEPHSENSLQVIGREDSGNTAQSTKERDCSHSGDQDGGNSAQITGEPHGGHSEDQDGGNSAQSTGEPQGGHSGEQDSENSAQSTGEHHSGHSGDQDGENSAQSTGEHRSGHSGDQDGENSAQSTGEHRSGHSGQQDGENAAQSTEQQSNSPPEKKFVEKNDCSAYVRDQPNKNQVNTCHQRLYPQSSGTEKTVEGHIVGDLAFSHSQLQKNKDRNPESVEVEEPEQSNPEVIEQQNLETGRLGDSPKNTSSSTDADVEMSSPARVHQDSSSPLDGQETGNDKEVPEEEEEEDFDDLTQDEDEMSSASEESVLSVPELQETMEKLTWLASERRLSQEGDSEDNSQEENTEPDEEEEEDAEGTEGLLHKPEGMTDEASEEREKLITNHNPSPPPEETITATAGERRRGGSKGQSSHRVRNRRGRARVSKDASKLVLLYDEKILMKDPLREQKDMAFAQSYLNRVREALHSIPGKYEQFLSLIYEFETSGDKKMAGIVYDSLRQLLHEWPQLLKDFAAFLLPEQALECGLFEEQQAFEKSRRFLRQLEICFMENPTQHQKIIKLLQSCADCSLKETGKLKTQMWQLLKGHTHLQEEFSLFFDQLRPPASRMDDFEVMNWSEDKEYKFDGFEEVTLPEMEEEEELNKMAPSQRNKRRKEINRGQEKDMDWLDGAKDCPCSCHEAGTEQRLKRCKRRICGHCSNKMCDGRSQRSTETGECKATEARGPSSSRGMSVVDGNVSGQRSRSASHMRSVAGTDRPRPQTKDSSRAASRGGRRHHKVPIPASLAETDRDCSPQPHTSPSLLNAGESTETPLACVPHPTVPEPHPSSREELPMSHAKDRNEQEEQTLTMCAKNVKVSSSGEKVILWTREADRVILTMCKERGAHDETFQAISIQMRNKSPSEVSQRFDELINLFQTSCASSSEEEEGDPETTAENSSEEED